MARLGGALFESNVRALRFFPYAKFEIRLRASERRLSCDNEWNCSSLISAMLHMIARKHNVLRILVPKQRPVYEEVWHLWTVIIPRRSIAGRLLRGTVLRRRDEGRWIYKKYIEGD